MRVFETRRVLLLLLSFSFSRSRVDLRGHQGHGDRMGQIGRAQEGVQHIAEGRSAHHIQRGLQVHGIRAREDHRQHDMRGLQRRPTGRLSGDCWKTAWGWYVAFVSRTVFQRFVLQGDSGGPMHRQLDSANVMEVIGKCERACLKNTHDVIRVLCTQESCLGARDAPGRTTRECTPEWPTTWNGSWTKPETSASVEPKVPERHRLLNNH